LKDIILFIWQLPQHLLALLLIRVLGAMETLSRTAIIYWFYEPKNWFGKFFSGVSLGNYIIIKTEDETMIKHENGHSFQSFYLGPLYLLVIGIPSAIGNLWDRIFHKNWTGEKRNRWYYNRYPEKWADKLGGVNRNEREV